MRRNECVRFLRSGIFLAICLSIAWVVLMVVGYRRCKQSSTQAEASRSFTPEAPAPLPPTNLQPPPAKQKPKKRYAWRPVYRGLLVNEATMYTKDCDGGNWNRPTASNNFGSSYPKKYKTLRWTIDNQGLICAVPWKHRWLKERLVRHPDGTMLQQYRVRFPWIDPPGTMRVPCDRVPYRDKHGRLLPQRDRYDIFVHMPRSQARKWGHPEVPIEVYSMEWVDVGVAEK